MDSCNPKPINYKQLYSASLHITNSKNDYPSCTHADKYIGLKHSICMMFISFGYKRYIRFGYRNRL